MSTETPQTPQFSRLFHLAGRLESDIRRKGLRPGDPYLTADAASSILGVSRITANRAMNVLAERQYLVRHGSRGTFIGPAADPPNDAPVGKCMHLITFVDENPASQVPVGEILAGLLPSFPDVSLDAHVMPLRNALQSIQKKFCSSIDDPSMAGVILGLGTREIQQYLADSGLPVVVHGSVFPGIQLPSVEVDQKQVGRLMADQAVRAGFKRLVFVGREVWRRGDNLAFDGVQEAAHAAGLGLDSVMVRNIPTTSAAIDTEFNHLLDEVGTSVALLCRMSFFAQAAASAAARRGLRIPEDLGIVYDASNPEGDPFLPFPAVRCKATPREQYLQIGRMLAQLVAGEVLDPQSVLFEVEESPAPAERRRPTT